MYGWYQLGIITNWDSGKSQLPEIRLFETWLFHSCAGVRIWRVRFRNYKPPLIHTKQGAITVSVLTGLLFGLLYSSAVIVELNSSLRHDCKEQMGN